MKLLQLNVWWGGKLEKNILKLLQDEQPDILCLQEAVSFPDKDAGLFLTIEQMQQQLNMPHVVFAPMFTFNLMHGQAGFGNCIISRLPITNQNVVYTNLQHIVDFDFNKHDYNVRNFIDTTIDIDGHACHVLTHHGYHVHEHKNGNEATMRQMQLLTDYVGTLEGPVILTGDFNLAPQSVSLQPLNNCLENLSATHHLTTTRSQLTHKQEVCDYVFVNDRVKVQSFGTSDALVSDHQALLLEFSL